ncbi:MAG: phosphoadenosine phosphosulfate reductase [Pseudomonadota bacterium]
MNDLDILEGLVASAVANPSGEDVASSPTPDLHQYDRILVMMSGKDSLACLLHLIELGAPLGRIELHHHDVDGRHAEPESTLMDWPCTHGYIVALGKAFGVPVLFSHRAGGIEREMLRENCGSAPIVYTKANGDLVTLASDRCKQSTRLKFPQVSASLITRWCSSAAKISVSDRLLIHDERFRKGRTLVVTGERAEESANRARYAEFEPHRADNRHGRIPRHIDAWRAVHRWTRQQVWQIIARHRCMAHPAYYVGAGRASCMKCVFNSSNAWATIRVVDPAGFAVIASYEQRFGVTIHRTRSVTAQANRGTPYAFEERWRAIAMSREFTQPIFIDPWVMPIGAFGESCGPT